MTANRDRVIDAAIELLATEGIRSLTHLRVDRRAGLPTGSTSNIFRTRDALLTGVATHMAEHELPAVTRGFQAASAEELTISLTALFDQLVGPGRTITAARLALYVEAGHDEAVRRAISAARARIQAPVRESFAALGAPDPGFATALIATCFEGLFLQVIGSLGEIDPAPLIAATLQAGLIGPLGRR